MLNLLKLNANMKRNPIILFILCLSISLIGCKKGGPTVAFNVSDSENFTIPANPTAISILSPVFTPPFNTTSWENQYSINNTDKNHIKSCNLTDLTLTITSPSGQTFGFVKSIHIFIQATNLPQVEVAYIDNNPTTAGTTITLIPDNNVDLSAYAKADSFTLGVETTTQQSTVNDVNVQANMTLHIVANVL